MMQIHRVKGRSMEDALHRARSVCGDDAVVLTQENVAGGGVTLSITAPPVAGVKISKEVRPAARGGNLGKTGGFVESADIVEVRQRLLTSGCSPQLVGRILEPVKRHLVLPQLEKRIGIFK